MSKKRIGIAVMALGMFLWAAAAYASPEAPRLLSPPMALPVPSGFLKVLLLLTFFVHLVLVNVLLGSVILSVIDRRASASDRKGGVAFMPKVLALAVNFGVAPFLFLQVLYGHFLYPSIVLMAVWWMFVALFAMLAYYGLYVSDGAVRPARRTPILFLSALLLLMTAFLLSNASTLMLRPDFWFRWFSEPHGHLLNTSDPTLFPPGASGGASVIRKWTGKRPSAVSAGGWIGFSTFPWRRFRWGCCSCSHCPRMCAAFFWEETRCPRRP